MDRDLIEQLKQEIRAQCGGQGFLPTRLDEVVLMRMDRHLPVAPTMYEPCILIVAQGRKVGTIGGKSHVYDTDHCLVLTLPLPFESETFGSPDEPFLGLAIKIAPPVVTELLVQMDHAPLPAGDHFGIPGVPVSTEVLSAALRLVRGLAAPERARVLGPAIIREVIYLMLRSPGGAALAGIALGNSHRRRMGKIIERMHKDYAAAITVPDLARESGMSASTFHARFKTVTGVAPLQYQKLIRLHKARDMMVNAGTSAQTASLAVGYESTSQFSREFRKVFGDSPGTVAKSLRARLIEIQQPKLAMTLSFA